MAPPPKPSGKVKTFVHIEILRYQPLSAVIMIGVDDKLIAFRNELLTLMGKYEVKRVDAVLVPCNREQVVKFEVENQEKADKEPQDSLGP